MNITCVLIIFALKIMHCKGAKILAVMATPSFSHQSFFRPLWREYLNQGHSLTLITTDPMSTEDHHPRLRQIDVSFVYDASEPQFQRLLDLHNDKLGEVYFLFEYLLNATSRELLHPEVQQLFTDTSISYDLLLIEDIASGMYVFKHRFNVPVIAVSSFDVPSWTHKIVGNPTHPLIYPDGNIPLMSETSWLWDRCIAVMSSLLLRIYYEYILIPIMDDMVKEVLPGSFPSVLKLQQRVDLLFANINPVFSNIRQFSPRTLSLAGGFHTNRGHKMSKDLHTFLEQSPEGVIYFSLGSNVKSKLLSPTLLQIFKETFRQLPYKVLWKYELDYMETKPTNVKIIKWCPQTSVLRHKNVRVFVNQGGLQSLEEALLAGVPVVTIPFVFDQEANAKRVVSTGIGVELTYKTLSVSEFKDAIFEVARNEKYKMATRKYADLVSNRLLTSLEDAMWWSEYLIKHKHVNHLKIPTIPVYQYYFLDIMAIFVLVIMLVGYVCLCICKLIQRILGTNKVKKQ